MNIEEYFKIGYISKTHGLKGEVTAVFENEIEMNGLTSLFLESRGTLVPYFIEKISGKPDKPFIKLEGVQSIEQAAQLKGRSIYLLKSARSKLKRGYFYDDEVVGFKVSDKILGLIGHVREIQSQGANRLMVIIYGSKEILVPVDSPFIKGLNKGKKSILIELPEGFLDI